MKFSTRLWLSALVSGALAMNACSVGAQSSPLEPRLKKVLADPAASGAAMTAAKKVTFFCDVCHGADGNSATSDVPNLAGQHPTYLLTQIDKFVRGQRHYKFMEGLMKLLSEDDRINATVYYSSKTVKPAGTGTSAAGKALYNLRCVGCHEAQGRGTESTPRVAGQQINYLNQSLTRYRDRSGQRIYEPMVASTTGLKDEDIAALTAFMSSMR